MRILEMISSATSAAQFARTPFTERNLVVRSNFEYIELRNFEYIELRTRTSNAFDPSLLGTWGLGSSPGPGYGPKFLGRAGPIRAGSD